MITHERWILAQEEERKFHNESFEVGFEHYRDSYRQYFNYLNINYDLKGKSIVEIGPADFPALAYCTNYGSSTRIIEPLPSDYLKRTGINIIAEPAEDAIYDADEVWLFNVLQHVLDPYKIVERAKKQAKVIRFFEPINYGVNDCHPWNLTMEMFKEWFGDAVQHYTPNQRVTNFHTWECCYGVFINK